ncbi:chromosome segregation protein ParM [Kitasatospora sp. NPDC058965]|uniref:chromosome segregation protein ParM n=1 Tax=Kitasatospora sp. NPDC058965 TaxID=3346682 RepID=UPI0036AE4FB2
MARLAVTIERTLYVAAAPILGAAANLPDHPAVGTSVAAAGAVGVLGSVAAVCAEKDNAGRWLVGLAPLTLAAGVDYAAHHIPGSPWDLVMAGAWGVVCWACVPVSKATGRYRPKKRKALRAAPAPMARVLTPVPEDAPQPVADTADDYTKGVRKLWERAGNPARTHVVLAKPHPATQHDFTLLVRANEPGRPITGLREADVAAAFGVHEDDIRFIETTQLAGRQAGPGWQEVEIIPDERHRRRTKPSVAEWWEDRIGESAIRDSRYVAHNRNEQKGVTYWRAQLPDSIGEPRMDLADLARAMGTTYEEGRVFVDTDGRQVLVTVWDVSPLAKVYPATRELLTPDKNGWWTAGFLGNGQPARNRVHTDRGMAHGLYVAPSGGGKTQLMALAVAANANWGAVVWLVTEAPDQKTAALGVHCDRYGVGPLYMVRAMRALVALMDIRGRMAWADGRVHDWTPNASGCPYRPLASFWDEYLSAATDGEYGDEIMELAKEISVKGRKYAIGESPAGQSVYVQDGFAQLLLENLRDNCIPVVLKVAPKKIQEMFKALGVAPDDIPEPLPRSFSPEPEGRIERIMQGEAEPPSDSNTGGVGWTVPGRKPEILRTLFMDFSEPIDHLFPEEVFGLTAHEIAELEGLGLWFDWDLPPQPGEFGDEPDEDDLDDWADDPKQPRKSSSKAGTKSAAMPGRSKLTNPQDALAALAKLEV